MGRICSTTWLKMKRKMNVASIWLNRPRCVMSPLTCDSPMNRAYAHCELWGRIRFRMRRDTYRASAQNKLGEDVARRPPILLEDTLRDLG